MNELPPPLTPKPDFFTYDHFTIFVSSEPALWIYGARLISISKHTPRVKVTGMTPLERASKSYKKARLPINGTDNEKGHFSTYSNGFAVEIPISHADSIINDPYVKQKIEEHYTYNYSPPTTTTP